MAARPSERVEGRGLRPSSGYELHARPRPGTCPPPSASRSACRNRPDHSEIDAALEARGPASRYWSKVHPAMPVCPRRGRASVGQLEVSMTRLADRLRPPSAAGAASTFSSARSARARNSRDRRPIEGRGRDQVRSGLEDRRTPRITSGRTAPHAVQLLQVVGRSSSVRRQARLRESTSSSRRAPG